MNSEIKMGQNININTVLVCKVVFYDIVPCISFKKKGDMFMRQVTMVCVHAYMCVHAERGAHRKRRISNNGRKRRTLGIFLKYII